MPLISPSWKHELEDPFYPPDLLAVPYLADAPYDADVVTMCPYGDGPQEVVDYHTASGFTGASISFWTLKCGHEDQDLSADTIEAVR